MAKKMTRARMAAEARRLCGCQKCVGGYKIEGVMVAMSVIAKLDRPKSCLANTLLKILMMDEDDALSALKPKSGT